MFLKKIILYLIIVSPIVLLAEGKKERKYLYKIFKKNPQELKSDEIQNNKERYKQVINKQIKKLKIKRFGENCGYIFLSTIIFISAYRLLDIMQSNKQTNERELSAWTSIGTASLLTAFVDYLASTTTSEIQKNQKILHLLQ